MATIKGGNITESILTSIKKLIGIDEEYDIFDTDLIIHINSVFMTLTQLGVGPAEGFSITDESEEWTDFLDDNKNLEAVKTYMYLQCKMVFDPPGSAALLDAMEKKIKEYEWRLNVAAESSQNN